jgi:hypothetical protein
MACDTDERPGAITTLPPRILCVSKLARFPAENEIGLEQHQVALPPELAANIVTCAYFILNIGFTRDRARTRIVPVPECSRFRCSRGHNFPFHIKRIQIFESFTDRDRRTFLSSLLFRKGMPDLMCDRPHFAPNLPRGDVSPIQPVRSTVGASAYLLCPTLCNSKPP